MNYDEQEELENRKHFDEILARYESERDKGHFGYYDSEDIEDMCAHYAHTGRLDEADRVLALGKRQHPDDESLTLVEVHLLLERSKLSEALELLNKKAAVLPDQGYMHYMKTAIYLDLKKFDEAVKEAKLTIECEPQDVYVYQDIAHLFHISRHTAEALDYLKQAEKMAPDDIDILIDIGHCLFHLNRTKEALDYANRIIDKDPYMADAWQMKASAHLDLDQNDEAIEALEYALAISPDEESLHLAKIKTLTMLNRQEEALKATDDFEREQPQLQSIVNMLRGDIYFWQSDMKTAHSYYRKGYDPEFFPIDSTIRYIDCKTRLHRWREALTIGKHLLKIVPNDIEIIERVADIYYELKQPEQSLKLIKRALRLTNNSTHFLLRYGSLLLDLDDEKRAYTAFRKARKTDPDNPLANTMMALMSFLRKEPRKMYRYLQLAQKSEPDIREGFFKLCPQAKPYVEQVDKIIQEGLDMGIKNAEEIVLGRGKL